MRQRADPGVGVLTQRFELVGLQRRAAAERVCLGLRELDRIARDGLLRIACKRGLDVGGSRSLVLHGHPPFRSKGSADESAAPPPDVPPADVFTNLPRRSSPAHQRWTDALR